VAGMLISFYEDKIKNSQFFYKKWLIIISLYSITAFWFCLNINVESQLVKLVIHTILNFFAFAPLYTLIIFRQIKGGIFKKYINKIAYAAYAIFLFHLPIWELMKDFWPKKGFYQWLFMFPLGYAIIFILSYFIQRGYDIFVKERMK